MTLAIILIIITMVVFLLFKLRAIGLREMEKERKQALKAKNKKYLNKYYGKRKYTPTPKPEVTKIPEKTSFLRLRKNNP